MLLTLLPTSAKFNSGPRKINKKGNGTITPCLFPSPSLHPCQPQMNKKGEERQRHRNRVRHVNHSLIHSFVDDWLIYHRFAKKYGSESIAGGWILRQFFFFFFFAESKIIKNPADRYRYHMYHCAVRYLKDKLQGIRDGNRSIIIIIIDVNHGNNQ